MGYFEAIRMGYFETIIEGLLEGKKYRRKEWPNDGTFICMNHEFLSIWKVKEKEFHNLIVSTGDLEGTDWEEFEPENKFSEITDMKMEFDITDKEKGNLLETVFTKKGEEHE